MDVTPDGQYMIVAGKLDPHVSVCSIERIKKVIAEKKLSGSGELGVQALGFEAVKVAQVELRLGRLRTQFSDKWYAYTSLFLDSAVARWSLGVNACRDGSVASIVRVMIRPKQEPHA